jgi:hypothetical protein
LPQFCAPLVGVLQSQLQVESELAWIREQMKAQEFAWQSTAIGALEVQAPADPTLLPK